MKYMLLMSSAPTEGVPPIHEWTPEDVQATEPT